MPVQLAHTNRDRASRVVMPVRRVAAVFTAGLVTGLTIIEVAVALVVR